MSKKQQEQPARARSSKVKVLSCVLILVAAIIAGILIDNATAGSRFESEITAINVAFAGNKTEKINEVLGRTVSSGSYAKVEKSLKKYVRDLIDNMNDINAVAESEVVYNSLEAGYLEENRDKLSNTLSELAKTSEKVKALTTDAEKLYNEAGAMTYIEDQDLSESYKGLFVDNAKAFYGDDSLRNNYIDTLKLLRSSVDVEIEAITFLNEHKDDWYVQDDQLKFRDDNVRKQYIGILEKVAKS